MRRGKREVVDTEAAIESRWLAEREKKRKKGREGKTEYI